LTETADITAMTAPIAYLTEPQKDLAAWVRYFSKAEIPILAETAAALEELREKEDDVDAVEVDEADFHAVPPSS
jgi:hypothetical protein